MMASSDWVDLEVGSLLRVDGPGIVGTVTAIRYDWDGFPDSCMVRPWDPPGGFIIDLTSCTPTELARVH